jgi:hypothetical protein
VRQNLDKLNIEFEKDWLIKRLFLNTLQQKTCPMPVLKKSKHGTLFTWVFLLPLRILQLLSKMFALSNTDAIHITQNLRKIRCFHLQQLLSMFWKVYFFFSKWMRKPDLEIYNSYQPDWCKTHSFVDDVRTLMQLSA